MKVIQNHNIRYTHEQSWSYFLIGFVVIYHHIY